MLAKNNPEIDPAVLLKQVQGELASAADEAKQPSPRKISAAEFESAAPAPSATLRLRQWLRSIPVIGSALGALNSLLRRLRAAEHLRDVPILGGMGAWVRSLLYLRTTRQTAHSSLAGVHQLQQKLREESQNSRDHAEMIGRELRRELAAQRMEVLFQQKRLLNLERLTARERDGETATGKTSPPSPAGAYGSLDGFFAEFQTRFRGDREDIKKRLSVYLDSVELAGAGTPELPILDGGCGMGEWLELLSERGLNNHGIETSRAAVDFCRRRGLNVLERDLVDHLKSVPDRSLGAITAFHVVEHLTTETLIEFLDQSLRTLASGGVLILETPNPENLIVGTLTFHNDPTHLKPLPPELLEFMVRQRGFIDAQILRLHPYPDDKAVAEDSDVARRLNELLYGPQDYAVIARRL
jgi:SAM-dependent methyltransferase